MAASNYFGFTHGAPQYSQQPTAVAYSHPSTAVSYTMPQAPTVYAPAAAAAAPAAAAAAAAARTAPTVAASPAYGAYAAAAAAAAAASHGADYGYAQRQQEAPPPPPPPTTTQNYQLIPQAMAAVIGHRRNHMHDVTHLPLPWEMQGPGQGNQETYTYVRSSAGVVGYDKQYYPQPAVSQPQHTGAETYYQSVIPPITSSLSVSAAQKVGFSQATPQFTQTQQPRQVTAIKQATPSTATSTYTVYPVSSAVQPVVAAAPAVVPSYTQSTSYSTTPVTYTGGAYSGYEAAVYSAATSYYQQQQQQQQQQQKHVSPWGASAFTKRSAFQGKPPRPKLSPKQPQLHYCDVCKISCAGPQTYREHLEGQKHKKKEAAAKAGTVTTTTAGRATQHQLRCELCDVTCTGADAYAAHIRGAKHQKVVKLHTKLGIPIPEPAQDSQPAATATTTAGAKAASATANSGAAATVAAKGTPASTPAPVTAAVSAAAAAAATVASPATKVLPKKVATPKITFVGGSKLQTTGGKMEEVKVAEAKAAEQPIVCQGEEAVESSPVQDVLPVGYDYVEEVCNDDGRVIRFYCKLCECSFNDPNAKEMHLKGRRHRLQYKKKVNPELQVEVKPSIRARKFQEERVRLSMQKEEYWRRREEDERWRQEMRRYEEELYWRRVEEEGPYWEERWRFDGFPPGPMHRLGPPMAPPAPMAMRRPDSLEDRQVMGKHTLIYPTEAELSAVQNIVSHVERALKLVSVLYSLPAAAAATAAAASTAQESTAPPPADKSDPPPPQRLLKGVMRVGLLAKGLLLRGDLSVELVLLSVQKPTKSLLLRVADALPAQLALVTDKKYEVTQKVDEAAVFIRAVGEPKTEVIVHLTSPDMRELLSDTRDKDADVTTGTAKDPPDVLDRQKCLDALAALRHAKWFQARATGLQSCVVIMRVLRDLCRRVPTWGSLPSWAMELLVEKAISSSAGPLSPGEALRRVLECLASGILFPNGPGLYDPCEKAPTDALALMTMQQREDVTASAQHALRLMTFRQVYKLLGMDTPPLRTQARSHNRKRRCDGGEEGDGDGKKDKKEA